MKYKICNCKLFQINGLTNISTNEMCFLLPLQGTLSIQDSEKYTMLNTNTAWFSTNASNLALVPNNSCILIYLTINPVFLYEQLGAAASRISYVNHPNNEELVAVLIRTAYVHTQSSDVSNFLVLKEIYGLLHIIERDYIEKIEDTSSIGDLSVKQSAKARTFFKYIEENYKLHISLQDAANAMGYTKPYLSNFLNKNLNTTFLTALTSTRVTAAERYVRFTDIPLERIASECGFSDFISFKESFAKTYGKLPEEYRDIEAASEKTDGIMKIMNTTVAKEFLGNRVLFNNQEKLHINRSEDVSAFANIKKSKPLYASWSELINLGSAEKFANPLFRKHIVLLQKSLHFRYGRITGILLLSEVYKQENNEYAFDFSRTFSVLDFVVSQNMIPFLDFDNKSPEIYHMNETQANTSLDFNEIGNLMIPAFLKACINYYGFEALSHWRFELWQQFYDVFMENIENPNNYVKRFSFFYKTIKNLIPRTQVGGPGFNVFATDSHFKELMKAFQHEKIHPDFISCYLYPNIKTKATEEETGSTSEISPDSDYFVKSLIKLKKIMHSYGLENIPLVATEFGASIFYHNHSNDSIFLSVYLIKNMLHCRKYLSYMGYWLASDSAITYRKSDDPLFGGNGLISRDGFRKPVFFAYSFLNHLGNRLIDEGSHHIITMDGDDIVILLYNYVHFTDDYCSHPEEYEKYLYPTGDFPDTAQINLNISISGVAKGTWHLVKQELSASNGCIYHEWGRLNFPDNLSEYERNYLFEACMPRMSMENIVVTENLELQESLDRHQVKFIILRKL